MTSSSLNPGGSQPPEIPALPKSPLPLSWSQRCASWTAHARDVLLKPATFSVLFVVLLFNVLIRVRWVQDSFPVLQSGELRFHRLLCSLSPRQITPKWVRVVEIDDAAHRKLGEPTNRAYLANLIVNAVNGDAGVIVLDFKLLAPKGMHAGQDEASRSNDNQKLLSSIRGAALGGVPVVIGVWLEQQPDGSFVRRPDVFLDSSLPLASTHGTCRAQAGAGPSGLASPDPDRTTACAWMGNINLPVDMRQVPLATPVKNSSAGGDSLALAAVSAYETSLDREPKLRDNPRIADSIAEGHFVYGSFIPESQFQTIPIDALASASPEALAECRGRIVLIGGNWHSDLGNGDLVDRHNTPVGPMVGMFAHANYIEALLDERYTREVPLWVGLGFDLIAGAALYLLFHRAKGWLAQLVVLIVPATFLVVSYIIFTNLNYYLDFILPLAACFVHLCVEYFDDYLHLRSHQPLRSAGGH